MKAKWNGSKWIRKERREAIYIRDGYECAYCAMDLRQAQREERTLDHLQPRSRGGNNKNDNLVTACADCNKRRGNKDLIVFASPEALDRIFDRIARPVDIAHAKLIVAAR